MNDLVKNKELRILFTGDLAPIGSAESNELNDYSLTIDYKLKELVNKSEIAITNLEAPLTLSKNKILKTGPHLKAHPSSVKLLKDIGINVACLSNNHIRDYGTQGVLDTIRICTDNGIEIVGAGINLANASKSLIKTINGKKIAIFNFSETEYNVATKERAGSNPDDFFHIWESISNAKKENDYIIAVMHGGKEMYPYPTPNQLKLFRFIVDIGANAVIGHHSHVIGGYEIYKGKPIVYSLGNFIFDEPDNDESWYKGAIVVLNFDGNMETTIKFYQTKLENSQLLIVNEQNANWQISSQFISSISEEMINSEWQKMIEKHYYNTIKNLITPNLLQRFLYKLGFKKISKTQRKYLSTLGNRFRCRTHHFFTVGILNKFLEKECLTKKL
jgi:poly-gamma-glutamate synthesis protein (capsule biosynthesis protein)